MKRNIIANYFGAGCVALAPVLALPWYLSSLGPEKFGLIGFVALVQALMGLIDAGMSQALVRAFSVQIDEGVDGRAGAADLLLGFERLSGVPEGEEPGVSVVREAAVLWNCLRPLTLAVPRTMSRIPCAMGSADFKRLRATGTSSPES
jgi:hypothetical protein